MEGYETPESGSSSSTPSPPPSPGPTSSTPLTALTAPAASTAILPPPQPQRNNIDNVLTLSENVNNENREIELLLGNDRNESVSNNTVAAPPIVIPFPSPQSSLSSSPSSSSLNTSGLVKTKDESNNCYKNDNSNNEVTPKVSEITNDESNCNKNDKSNNEVTSKVNEQPSVVNAAENNNDTETYNDEHYKHITYNDEGKAIYTDPNTQCQYEFDNEKNDWIPLTVVNQYENEHYRWCPIANVWLPKDFKPFPVPGTNKSATENPFYKYDAEKNEWILKQKIVNTPLEDGTMLHTCKDDDGVVYFWDTNKSAWFPKIDDDFMAQYQMSYGCYDDTEDLKKEEEQILKAIALAKEKLLAKTETETTATAEAATTETPSTTATSSKRKAPQEDPKWFDIPLEKNTKVYVSNLPTDITEKEFIEIMSKYGMIMRDPANQQMKIKLYSEQNGQKKGDGLCDYIRVESVEMALKLLDGSDIRGKKIKVERAKFQQRGEYNPALKPKKKKKDKEKIKKMQEKLFDWRPEKMRGERSKHEKIVIIKNLFAPELFEKEVQLLIDYQNDLREECSKCGTVRKVTIFDRHPEGVAQINMADAEEADLVIQMMHKRFFGKRQLIAECWDGVTKYKIDETTAEEEQRLSNWDTFLVDEEKKEQESLKINDNDESIKVVAEKTNMFDNLSSENNE